MDGFMNIMFTELKPIEMEVTMLDVALKQNRQGQ
jgi:hypothetical protein